MKRTEELPEPNISAFIDELAHLVDKLFPNLRPDLRMFIASEMDFSEEFTSEIPMSFEYGCWEDDPIQAIRDVVEEFRNHTQDQLIDLLNNSLLPDMLGYWGAEEEYIIDLSDSAHHDFQLLASNQVFLLEIKKLPKAS